MKTSTALAGCSAAALIACLGNPATSQGAPRGQPHIDRKYGWSITYPSDWRVAQKGYTEFTPKSNDAVCGVHVATRPPATTNQLTDAVLATMARNLERDSGLKTTVLARKTVKLLSGQSANDVLVDLIPGGRSHRLFVVAENGRGYLIDCETYLAKWHDYQSIFESFIQSLRID
ncbi:MAG: hypothetical protein RLZZ124_1622 [Cyanobacteriota bacterium]